MDYKSLLFSCFSRVSTCLKLSHPSMLSLWSLAYCIPDSCTRARSEGMQSSSQYSRYDYRKGQNNVFEETDIGSYEHCAKG